jgi:hypothetical protein
MTMIDPERVTHEAAMKRGVNELLGEAARRPIAVSTDEGEVFLLSKDIVERVIDALELRDDLYDAVLVITRMLTDTGERYPLDAIIEKYGFTQEEIDAAPD